MRQEIVRDIQDSIRVKEALLKSDVPDLVERAALKIFDCFKNQKKVLFFGNGGSAADSQHLSAEFVGRYEKERRALPAIALTTDTSALTAIANDYGYEKVFSRQIEALGVAGDVAFGFSTSGNSKNVILAFEKAKECGLYTIGFTGRDGGQIRLAADLCIVVPSEKTSRIQESHGLLGHILCERIDELFAHA